MARIIMLSSSLTSFPSIAVARGASKPKPSKIFAGTSFLSTPCSDFSSKEVETKNVKWKQMTPEKLEMFKHLEGWVEDHMLSYLKPVEEAWQPQDFLPNPSSSSDEEFFDSIREIRDRAAGIPDEYYVCLVGNMVTEEALPTYQTFINSLDGVRDDTGASSSPWARWGRMWTAEENRHGDLLNKYLYLSGRLDMRHVEKTIQYLIGSGMDFGAEHNPYCGFIYTSFQERATFTSHGNTARQAKGHGDLMLAKICGLIAADEKRHEMAYTRAVEKLFEIDPDTTMLALADMMKRKIKMPALFMFDGQDHSLFDHYSAIARELGVYTTKDYANNVEYFVKRWNVDKLSGLSAEGRHAQEYVCGLADRFRKMEERAEERKKRKQSSHMVPFSWIFNNNVAFQ